LAKLTANSFAPGADGLRESSSSIADKQRGKSCREGELDYDFVTAIAAWHVKVLDATNKFIVIDSKRHDPSRVLRTLAGVPDARLPREIARCRFVQRDEFVLRKL